MSEPLEADPACIACELARDESAPGGCIHETDHWYVDHCIGPLGVGTLIVRPKRHVVHVADLTPTEAAEMVTVLHEAAQVVTHVESPEQVYVTLWSHMHAVPGHIHFVVQPVTRARMEEHDGKHGCRLQVEMFDRQVFPDAAEAASFAERARAAWPTARPDQPLVA